MMCLENEQSDQGVIDQKARTILRESFLRAINDLIGSSCSMLTYEQSTLKSTITAWKPDGTEILVSDLETPAGIKIQSALLRTPDILAIHFDEPVQ